MEIDFSTLTEYQRYKLMASLIVPRPIALVTTLSAAGTVNAAPFSMFNMLGEEPPIVMISINRLKQGELKDTAANIERSGEFVVHLADERMAEQMHRCGERLPNHMSEIEHVGLTTTPSRSISPPRIVEAPVAFECTLWETLSIPSRQIFIGQVRWLHTAADLIDTELWRVKLQNYFPVGRFGASFYVNTRERFSLETRNGEPHNATVIDEI